MARSNWSGPIRVKSKTTDTSTDAAIEVLNTSGTTRTVVDRAQNVYNKGENVLNTDTKNLKLVAGNVLFPATVGKVTIDLSAELASITAIDVGGSRTMNPGASAPVAAKNNAPVIMETLIQSGAPASAIVYGFTEAKAKSTVQATLPYFAVGPPA